MKHLHWKNAEGLELYAAEWPVENPRAVIALVHGQGEHIGRYSHLAEWYNQHGIAVLGFDHQGYGQSEGKRGHAKNLEVLLDDIGLLLEKARAIYPGRPLFMYGQSMGGGLALNYTTRRKAALTGLIATSPWIRLAFEAPAIKVLAGKIMRRIWPGLSLPTGLDPNGLSRDQAVVQAYLKDPLVHDKLSAAAGISLIEAAKWLDQWTGQFDFPVLLQHGTGDPITSFQATKAFAERVRSEVTFLEWPELYHEIHNEKEKYAVFESTLNWINGVLSRAAK